MVELALAAAMGLGRRCDPGEGLGERQQPCRRLRLLEGLLDLL
jgi:hypothetical protein